MKFEFSRHTFEKSLNIEFHENPSRGCRVVPCGWTDGRTDMTKLIVAFLNFANAPKNDVLFIVLFFSNRKNSEVRNNTKSVTTY
jgi:hypothetical protein